MSSIDYGPQYRGDDPLTRRVRFHQSWWRHDRLELPYGTDARGNPYGNYLTEADALAGRNFLTPAIHWCTRERMASRGGVEEFRCTRNLLSSQPMAFNIFGPLHHDPDLAAALLDPLLPGGVTSASVHIEWAPPKELHLADATSFDAAVRYTTRSGYPALAAIETKLTEPFSQKTYGRGDRHAIRYREVARQSTAWLDPDATELADLGWNQLWRNHLLVESIGQREPGLLGCQIVVRHPLDTRCATAIQRYGQLLTDPNRVLVDLPLDRLVDAWTPLTNATDHCEWTANLADRYVNLHLSEEAFVNPNVSVGRG